jgi:hypothetical protein
MHYSGYGQSSGYSTTTTTTTTSPSSYSSKTMTNSQQFTTAPIGRNLSGNVVTNVATTENPRLWGNVESKTLTLEPGRGQISLDNVGINDAVQLTLINPTNTPMHFETTKRLGQEVSLVVPPNSQSVVSFRFNKPLSDEVEFLVYQDPSAAIAQAEANIAAAQMPAQTATTVEQQTTQTSSTIEPAQPQQPPVQQQSTVRGFW